MLISHFGHQLTEEGYFVGGNVITFSDFSTERSFVVCAQPGCTHGDSLCSAFLGGINNEYALYRGVFYTLITEHGGESEWHYTFKSREPEDAAWQTLWAHSLATGTAGNVVVRLGGGYAAIMVRETIWDEQHADRGYTHLVAVNLDAGTVENIMPRREDINSESHLLYGTAEGKAVIAWTGFDREIIPHDDFVRQSIEDDGVSAEDATDSWFRLLEESRINRILIADLATGAITEIASGPRSVLPLPTHPNFVYKGMVYYYYDGAIISYSLRDAQAKELLRIPDVVNVFAFDGRVFYITSTNYEHSFFYHILESGEAHQLNNGNNKEVMIMSINYENNTMFMGLHNGGWNVLISKEDFYNEDYDRAIRVG